MGWLRLGGDVTASDYLLDSDRMARKAAQSAIADMERQRKGEQAHCNPGSCDSDGHTVRWPNVTYRWDWAARNESRFLARRAYRKQLAKFMTYESNVTRSLRNASAAAAARDGAGGNVPWSMIYSTDKRFPRVPRFRHGFNRTEFYSRTLNTTLPASDRRSWRKTRDLPDFH